MKRSCGSPAAQRFGGAHRPPVRNAASECRGSPAPAVMPRSHACEQQIDDLLAGGFIEVAGRLVGHQNGGIGRQRAEPTLRALFGRR